jgi:hypothetical protein
MNRRALSAVELMVAIAVTGMAASIGAATLALLGDRRAIVAAPPGDMERAAAVRRTLVAWLEGAHGPLSALSGAPAAVFQLLDQTRQGRPADDLLFSTSAETPLGTGDALVRLHVVPDPEAPEHGLVADIAPSPGAAGIRVVLDSTITELDARVLTDLAGPSWLPNFLSPQLVPRGVQLRLGGTSPGISPLLRLPITVAVEAGR